MIFFNKQIRGGGGAYCKLFEFETDIQMLETEKRAYNAAGEKSE